MTTRRRAQIFSPVVVIVLAVLLGAWQHFSARVTTDDAQIDGHVNAVATRVGGTVTAVLVSDNQYVEKGTPLVRIDARDYEIAVARAEADLAESEASARAARTGVPMTSTVSTSEAAAAGSDLEGAEARLVSARARLREAEANATRAAHDLERLKPLVAKDEVSKQEYDKAVSEADAAHAAAESAAAAVHEADKGVEAARARLAQAKTGPEQVTIQKARADSATARAEIARANLALARLNLEHTEITGAAPAHIGEEGIEEVVPSRLLVGEVLGGAQGALALDEHPDEPCAVRRRIVPTADGEHSAIAQVFEAVRGLAHRLEDSSAPARLPMPASPGSRRCAWPASAGAAPARSRPLARGPARARAAAGRP